MEVAAGDGKLIKLSLIYPSPRGRPTHGISRSSIFVLSLRRRRHHVRRATLRHLPSSLVAPSSRYLPVALFLLLFVSFRFRTLPHAGFEAAETKRLNISIWHQPLFSMPRSGALYTSLCLIVLPRSIPLCVARFSSYPPRPVAGREGSQTTSARREKGRERRHEG